MSNARFVRKTELSGLTMLRLDQQPIVDRYNALRDGIVSKAGEAAANLFAEPVITLSGAGTAATISWYTAWPGDPRLLSDVAIDDRPRFQAALRQALDPILALIDDREIGLLLRLALVIPDESHIAFAGDYPVLTGWGLAPDLAAQDRKALSVHLARVYGSIAPALGQVGASFFDDLSRPALRQSAAAMPAVPAVVTGAATAAAVGTSASSSAKIAPPVSAPPVMRGGGGGRGSVWSWWLLPAGLLFAMLFFCLGLWFGWRYFTDQISHTVLTADISTDTGLQQQLDDQRRINDGLEKQIVAAKAALALDMCKVPNPVAPILSAPLPDAPPATPLAPADQTPAP